jgi:hypothetical protein
MGSHICHLILRESRLTESVAGIRAFGDAYSVAVQSSELREQAVWRNSIHPRSIRLSKYRAGVDWPHPTLWDLRKCEYKDEDKKNALREYILGYVRTCASGQGSSGTQRGFTFGLHRFIAVLKNVAFEDEQEARLVSPFPQPSAVHPELVRHREGSSNLVPYVTAPFQRGIIRQIIVGPGPSQSRAADGVRSLLLSKGMDVADHPSKDIRAPLSCQCGKRVHVNKSPIPYQPW